MGRGHIFIMARTDEIKLVLFRTWIMDECSGQLIPLLLFSHFLTQAALVSFKLPLVPHHKFSKALFLKEKYIIYAYEFLLIAKLACHLSFKDFKHLLIHTV
jgi:hypothetical protein